jgi:hypothetical protein
MTTLYQTLKTKTKISPRFYFKYLTFKCPAFIAEAIGRKQHTQLPETRHWWDNYPEADSVQYDNNTNQYQPKYQ